MTAHTVKLFGDFDFSRKGELEQLLAAAAQADVAVIDLRDVSYLDSSVLTSLMNLKRRMEARGEAGTIRIVGANQSLRRIFTICGLDRYFEFSSVT
ncbi:MAG TPA: STAS domain-containing protein [Candidatus Rubrimentiphilum sp.]|nr:STAS domain-containing protein [Candidatus Rubrimentiphilum sp.]